jgi:hypothetical protein
VQRKKSAPGRCSRFIVFVHFGQVRVFSMASAHWNIGTII